MARAVPLAVPGAVTLLAIGLRTLGLGLQLRLTQPGGTLGRAFLAAKLGGDVTGLGHQLTGGRELVTGLDAGQLCDQLLLAGAGPVGHREAGLDRQLGAAVDGPRGVADVVQRGFELGRQLFAFIFLGVLDGAAGEPHGQADDGTTDQQPGEPGRA